MGYEKSCGAVVFRRYHGNTELLLIKHTAGGHWSFPKGHVEKGETEEETAVREVYEETHIQIDLCPGFREHFRVLRVISVGLHRIHPFLPRAFSLFCLPLRESARTRCHPETILPDPAPPELR